MDSQNNLIQSMTFKELWSNMPPKERVPWMAERIYEMNLGCKGCQARVGRLEDQVGTANPQDGTLTERIQNLEGQDGKRHKTSGAIGGLIGAGGIALGIAFFEAVKAYFQKHPSP